MIAFIEDHRSLYGVEPICRVLPIAPATYYARSAIVRTPELASDRGGRDTLDKAHIKRVFDASGGRYGARKIWYALRLEGKNIARCTVDAPDKRIGDTRGCARHEGHHNQF